MAKLSDAMVKGLRSVADGNCQVVHGRTINALRGRFLVKPGAESGTYAITLTGRRVLDGIDCEEREQAERLEKASRPVPASAFVEPSASRPVAAFPEYDDAAEAAEAQDESTGDLSAPAVPQAWIDQLVTLLDADARIVLGPQRWGVQSVPDVIRSWLQPERVDMTVHEAIRLGIAEALPPTPGQGVVRLAFTDTYRTFMAGRVKAKGCPHYMSAMEARAGFTKCERC